ncbi:MAG: Do family serine endopeptidase [Polyangiaceae bacterium]|nr:Do family serine endopeptidase [Polyangiaceae bacterium]
MPTPPVLAGAADVATLVERVQPAVVNITTTVAVAVQTVDPFEFFFGPRNPGPNHPNRRTPPFIPSVPRVQESRSLGSGFVIDAAGYVVTNNHVIDQATEVMVRFADDRSYPARVVGRDRKLDIALLKLDGAGKLSPVVLGDSDALRVGEYVIAVGNPFGLGHTVTMGIVSAKDRTIGAGPYDDFIQTDASINPGNSGGPLFNLRGELVGINTVVHREAQGIGFAIPINLVRDVVFQLRDKGYVSRGRLGIGFQAVNEDIARAMRLDRPRGALVSSVETASPAERAGIVVGDLIVDVNGTELARDNDLPRIIAANQPGSTVKIGYIRNGRRFDTTATLDALEDGEKQPPTDRAGTGAVPTGLVMQPNPDGGVVVVSVSGDFAGKLHKGDIIDAVDGQRTSTPEQVNTGLSNAKKAGKPALIRIRRGNTTMFIAM